MRGAPQQRRGPFYRLCLLHAVWISGLILWAQQPLLQADRGWVVVLGWTKAAFEMCFAFFLVATVLKCVEHATLSGSARRRGEAGSPPSVQPPIPPLAVIYLCCGDLDRGALLSLARLRTAGDIVVFVHDDDGQGHPTEEVRQAVEEIARETGCRIELLARPRREGGKPGAVNFTLERVPRRYHFVLIADSDSYAVDVSRLPEAMARFNDPAVGGIQFRNTGLQGGRSGSVRDALCRAIDVFDVFASHQARHGLMPFLGHNGVLRRASLEGVGGLGLGMLSDDIDVSLKLALRGQRIEYAREVTFGETVPGSYKAFRRRARKWAVGCTQVFRNHGLSVLASRTLSWRQKVGFAEFCGFYMIQVCLLAYLALAYIALPMLAPTTHVAAGPSFLAGAAVCLAILAPAAMHGDARGAGRFTFAWRCAMAYGSLGAATALGVIEGLVRGGTEWVPTARAGGGFPFPPSTPLELAFGVALFTTPLVWQPVLLLMPSTYLFAAVFLSVPLIAWVYRPGADGPSARKPVAAIAGVVLLAVLGASAAGSVGERESPAPPRPTAIDGRLMIDGEPFLVKGMHYSPYPPGTGPQHGGWPDADVIAADFSILEEIGANTILIHDAPRSVLDRARRHGIRAIYAFTVNWQGLHDPDAFQRLLQEIGRRADDLAGHPALLYYLVGNEVPQWVVEQRGADWVAGRIEQLTDAIRRHDPGALVSHANWPPTRNLDLSFLDVVSFNVYPAWPREVAIAGYHRYVRDVLVPLAGDRPLVITEFGQNTLEATEQRQAELLEECWETIRSLTSGGVVFAFADEWWKNYDNPIEGAGYWEREHAPDDHKVHDLDPEEYYGILTASRQPKPAFHTVKSFFAEAPSRASWGRLRWSFVVFLGLVLIYTAWVFWPRSGGRMDEGGSDAVE